MKTYQNSVKFILSSVIYKIHLIWSYVRLASESVSKIPKIVWFFKKKFIAWPLGHTKTVLSSVLYKMLKTFDTIRCPVGLNSLLVRKFNSLKNVCWVVMRSYQDSVESTLSSLKIRKFKTFERNQMFVWSLRVFPKIPKGILWTGK